MKNKILGLAILSLPLWSLASSAQSSLDTCMHVAAQTGVIDNPAPMPGECSELIAQSAGAKAHAISSDGLLEVYGFGPIAYLKYYENKTPEEKALLGAEAITGTKTKLSSISIVQLNEQEKRVYILNRDGESSSILSYHLEYGGNLAPLRKLVGEAMAGASDFTIDQENKKLIVISQKFGWLKSFELHADPDGRSPANALAPIAEISSSFTSPLAVEKSPSNIFVLDSNKVLVFESQLSDEAQALQELSIEGEFGEGSVLEFNQKENALLVRNQKGVEIIFEKSLAGDFRRLN